MDPPATRARTTRSKPTPHDRSIAGSTDWKRTTNENVATAAAAVVKSSSSSSSSAASVRENWMDVMDMIRKNPLLITPHVFGTTLKRDPPLDVIELMLLLQPSVANIPKQGPTALQVAVQHGASCEVVRAVLKACPFALCVTNPQCPEDPLSYAKRHRKKEIELIQLLSCPLSDWITNEERTNRRSVPSSTAPEENSDQGLSEEPASPKELPSPIPVATTKNSILRQELNNVKLLCAQVLKGHQKLSKQLRECQEQLAKQSIGNTTTTTTTTSNLKLDDVFLQNLHKQQQIHFRRQLIALDMKERAFLARVKEAEEECRNQCSEEWSAWKQSMEDWKTQTNKQWKEWETKQDQEMKLNARFRRSMCRWMDMQYHNDDFPRLKDDSLEYQDFVPDDVTPVLFATNLGEVGDNVPLYTSASSSSSYSSSDGAASRETRVRDPVRNHGMPTTSAATTTLRSSFPRRHAWKAHARKLDCSAHLR